MVHSPSWAANGFAASQEIPSISRNPKVHYRTHKRPPPVSILGQPIPVHIPTSHLLEIHPNIIHPSTPRSPQWSLSLQFPHQDPIHPPLHTHTGHTVSPQLRTTITDRWRSRTAPISPRHASNSLLTSQSVPHQNKIRSTRKFVCIETFKHDKLTWITYKYPGRTAQ